MLPLLLITLLVAAYSDTSSNLPIARAGDVLDVTVLNIERLAELRYSNLFQGRVINHFRLTPTEEEKELVLLRVRVGNGIAATAVVAVDGQAAQLGDLSQGVYLPMDVQTHGEG